MEYGRGRRNFRIFTENSIGFRRLIGRAAYLDKKKQSGLDKSSFFQSYPDMFNSGSSSGPMMEDMCDRQYSAKLGSNLQVHYDPIPSGNYLIPVAKSDVNLYANSILNNERVVIEPSVDERVAILGNYMINSKKYIKDLSKPVGEQSSCKIPNTKAGNTSNSSGISCPMVADVNASVRSDHMLNNGDGSGQSLNFDALFGPENKFGNGFFSSGRVSSVAGHGRSSRGRDNGFGGFRKNDKPSFNSIPSEANFSGVKTVPDVVMEDRMENHGEPFKVSQANQPVNA
ncbi:hypothetical protein L6452_25061 [Arctium lappa]|uniref:Uncharacterized protein n=1 Tax=Arctium lappa TaxID=4217 RepID=A0ACB9AAC9_ARCLA|nr:hypothetical protein L6452_25061 [Arctium lappa]